MEIVSLSIHNDTRVSQLFCALTHVRPLDDWEDLLDKAGALVLLADEYGVACERVEREWVRVERDLSLAQFERWARSLQPPDEVKLCPQCLELSALLIGEDRWLCPHCACEVQ
jgi:hypothetical protein